MTGKIDNLTRNFLYSKTEMAERINKVILVLDRNYGEELSHRAAESHVWLIDSVANRGAASDYRALHGGSKDVTTFTAADDDSPSETCLKVLDQIDLHHGEYSSNPPYSVLEVVGTGFSGPVKVAVEKLGFSRVEPTVNGFKASR